MDPQELSRAEVSRRLVGRRLAYSFPLEGVYRSADMKNRGRCVQFIAGTLHMGHHLQVRDDSGYWYLISPAWVTAVDVPEVV